MTTSTTPPALTEIGFNWHGHHAALWWLGFLYRRPNEFQNAFKKLKYREATKILFIMIASIIPYILISRCIILAIFNLPDIINKSSAIDLLIYFYDHVFVWNTSSWITNGFFGALTGGIAIGFTGGIAGIVIGGLTGGITTMIMNGIVSGVTDSIAGAAVAGITGGVAFGITTGIRYEIATGIFIGIIGGLSSGLIFGIPTGLALGVTFIVSYSRVYYWPIHFLFLWPKVRSQSYPYHPVAWDDLCKVPFPGLERLLAAHACCDWTAGSAEIVRLLSNYHSQQMAALKALTIIWIRSTHSITNLAKLETLSTLLPEGEKGFLKQASSIKHEIRTIARMQRDIDARERQLFKEPLATALLVQIDAFQGKLYGLKEPLRSELQAASAHWLALANQQQRELQAGLEHQTAQQLFRAGDPVNRDQEAFVPRWSVLEELDRQVLLASGCPGLLLYGRRRTGKSSVLKNLSSLMSSGVLTVELSMLNPQVSASLDQFLIHIIDGIGQALGKNIQPIPADTLALPAFFEAISAVDYELKVLGKRLLLTIDEFELLDKLIGENRFDERLLETIRHSIQVHRQIIWLFAGSHSLDELPNVQWASYFISLRTVPVEMFTAHETRMLLTEPLSMSTLWIKNDPKRPRFGEEFWGKDGLEWIHTYAGGWPHLVQLLAEAAIDVINDRGTTGLNPDLWDDVAEKARKRGNNVLRQLLYGECGEVGEWEYLFGFADTPTLPPPESAAVRRSLHRRELVVVEDGVWRLRVPLMQLWLTANRNLL